MASENVVSSGELSPTVSIREIHKNGWLKKFIEQERSGRSPNKVPIITKGEKLWVVFCIHEDDDPFLEGYTTQVNSLQHQPLVKWSLKNCQHISPNILAEDDEHLFTITLGDKSVHLAASSRELMLEWVDIIRNKLRALGIISPHGNIYSREPELRSPLAQSRDPTSPLPPTPGFSFPFPPASGLSSSNVSEQQEINLRPDDMQPVTNVDAVELRQEVYSHLAPHSAPIPLADTPTLPSDRSIFNFDRMSNALLSRPYSWTEFSTDQTQDELESDASNRESNPLYEPLFLAHTAPSMSSSTNSGNEENVSEENISRSAYENVESYGFQRQNSSETGVASESQEEGVDETLSLKQKQILQLQKEMRHPGGILLKLRLKDCTNSIAFVDLFGATWIAGWKQREHPFLYNSFHIGDKVISIDRLRISTSHEARRVIKQTYTPNIEIVVARLPFGRAFAIRREFEGQGLGIEREKNTAEIVGISPDGLAARHGLPAQVMSLQGNSFCNWVLTEINGRPLNLFFKNNEIEARLMAVGKDITILVQPIDFIKALKRQLKTLRNYKDYIVQ